MKTHLIDFVRMLNQKGFCEQRKDGEPITGRRSKTTCVPCLYGAREHFEERLDDYDMRIKQVERYDLIASIDHRPDRVQWVARPYQLRYKGRNFFVKMPERDMGYWPRRIVDEATGHENIHLSFDEGWTEGEINWHMQPMLDSMIRHIAGRDQGPAT